MQITERLARFVEETRFETLSADVVNAARRAILDTLGVTLAGAAEEGSRILLDSITPIAGSGAASVFGTALRTTPAQAALANGVLGHALDFDDVNTDMRGHPSVPVLPAVLALAEPSGASGRDAITAFVVGFEVECRLGRALGLSSYAKGWHATSVTGAIGAAAASARLLGLNADQTRHALGVATSMASGSRQNFGTMTKPLHAGLAARAGVEAAELASRGFSAAPDILEAPLGFGELFSPGGDWQPERVGDPGKPWQVLTPGIHVKKYPCCHMTHRALDATLAATRGTPQDADSIRSIAVEVPAGSIPALIHHRPTTGLEGKFSMEYCTAAAVIDGTVGLSSFGDEQVRRPAAQGLLRRVQVVEVQWKRETGAPLTRVRVELTGGEELRAEVARERGDPRDPLSWEELEMKFRDCAVRALPVEQVEQSLQRIAHLEAHRIDQLAADLSIRAGESANRQQGDTR